jgi:hypothetical protein
LLEDYRDEGSAEGKAQTESNVVFIGCLEGKSFVHDCSGGEEIEGDCEEERNHHEALPNGHANGRDRGHDQGVYGPIVLEGFEEEIAAHAHHRVRDDLGDMNAIEDFGQSAFGWIFEVKDQGEDELVVDVAEDDGGQTLHLLRVVTPPVQRCPLQIWPVHPAYPFVL